MASNMDPTMGALVAPSASTLDSLKQGSSGFFQGAQQGSQTAVQLATMDDQVQQQKMKTEQMKDQLDQSKYNKMVGGITAITRADPKYRSAIADQVFKGFDRNQIAVDPVWRDALVKDDSTLTQMRQALPILMQKNADPAARAQAMQAFANYIDPTGVGDGHDKLQALIDGEQKRQSAETMSAAHNDAMVKAAQVRAQATAASPRAVTADDRFTQSVNDKFDSDPLIRPYIKAQDSIGRGYLTLTNPPDGKVTTQLVKEVSNDIAQSLAMGAATSADDREKQEYKGLQSKFAQIESYVSSNPQNLDAPGLVKYLKENLKRIDDAFQVNIAQRSKDLAQGRDYRSAGAQSAVQKKLGVYSKRSGIANAMASAAPPPADAFATFSSNAKAHGYSDDEIKASWAKKQGAQ